MARGKMKILNYNLSQIKTLIAEGTDILVITSPANLGKNALSNLKNSNWRISLIRANANTNIDSLSHDIIQQALPDKAEDTLPIISQVHKYLEYSAKNGIVPVIIVEDAHELPLETLKFVLQLAELRYAESLFRIVLFADKTINDRIDDPKLKGFTTGVLRNIHIPSFSEEKTEEYIDNLPLPSDEIDDYLFAELDIEEDTETDTSKSYYGRFIIGIGLIFIISIVMYFNNQKDEKITKPESISPTQTQKLISEENQIDVQQTEPLGEEEQELEDEDVKVSDDDLIIDDMLPPSVSELSIEENFSEDMLDLQATEADEDMDTSLIELPVYIEVIEHPIIEEVEEELIPETHDENVFNLETVPDFLSGIKGPNWLRQQPAESYVLQLISAQYMSNLENLLNGQSTIQNQLSGYVKYTPSGKPRYLLLYGAYPNGKTARAAIDQLSTDLQSINPWPRTIEDVIKELDTVSLPLTEIEEGIEVPLVELAEDVGEMEHPVVEEVEEELISETDEENIYNLGTVPDFLSGVKGPNWLRQQPTESYVLQLVSAQYMSNIKNLLSGQSDNQDQLSGYVKYTPSGRPRYLLLYGIYPNGKTAKAAINQLPIELKSTNPWPRTIGDVIKELDTVSEPSIEEDMSEGISGFG